MSRIILMMLVLGTVVGTVLVSSVLAERLASSGPLSLSSPAEAQASVLLSGLPKAPASRSAVADQVCRRLEHVGKVLSTGLVGDSLAIDVASNALEELDRVRWLATTPGHFGIFLIAPALDQTLVAKERLLANPVAGKRLVWPLGTARDLGEAIVVLDREDTGIADIRFEHCAREIGGWLGLEFRLSPADGEKMRVLSTANINRSIVFTCDEHLFAVATIRDEVGRDLKITVSPEADETWKRDIVAIANGGPLPSTVELTAAFETNL